ncbi:MULTISPECIES: 16S rRNA (adenine(1518)-N(6)/adenine(1519)-N(6))-dimethyltransferase RsmA [Dethiosulfovibrio]|uniref:Ribosomal RNA small subunit methyltransferase A n=2 Tax=Dethiosulfovibrio TaxID=47054 RepID=A0ABS9EL65_9BACT|nr:MULTISPECIES: 16S rRNA (adenine(1518)-N(6)/adenine(1519)-N(6))-dimethyltransferase RsmA [Dethiosulfovibrio]MCF4113483.1 16S rRNA (adenine(1518)-N(6)/adenine(1519)-N(6))-dimethyltransferase RsmA [Dethiosulfovibrio russensis]MCF4141953.1 16S rRNA (adenine(1518)-N(6)/adenine(1519)-N(6))-dimethyltransferase RsmA [Dethiosulfovibrio marinus]MCF4144108.1 16S rRNA (adenine(1518)-N(6)/adenine(1519)-N(6))-dimethyltransferase RsmA [Dethiosulfovibrio acidaminovorans]
MRDAPSFTPRTSLGQNFLINRDIVRRTVEKADITENDVILEIGPGQGVLTREILSSRCSHLHSIEIDRRLEPFLQDIEGDDRFSLHWGDGVKFPYGELRPVPSKVVANIPYHVTTPLIWSILEKLAPSGLSYMIMMVQKEAADRLVAQASTKERYPLGITLAAMGSAKTYMKVSPGSFRPIPKVSSALVELTIERRRDLPSDDLWRKVLKAGFSQRRKKLANNLVSLGVKKEEILALMDRSDIPSEARAETLSVSQWLEFVESLRRAV